MRSEEEEERGTRLLPLSTFTPDHRLSVCCMGSQALSGNVGRDPHREGLTVLSLIFHQLLLLCLFPYYIIKTQREFSVSSRAEPWS